MNFEELKELIAEKLDIEEDMVEMDAVFLEDFGCEQEDLDELLLSVEEHFDIDCGDDEFNFETVKDLYNYIEGKL